MRLSNGLFAHAIDWIYANTQVKDQKTLAAHTKITETTISRILNDKVKKPSEDTIIKLNDAFGGIFNLAYFRGESTFLLIKDVIDEKMQKQKAISPSTDEPTANIIELCATLIKEVEGLRQQLNEEIAEFHSLNREYRQQLAALKGKGITYQSPDEAPRLAAEEIKK